jgi:hypothetical protein
MKYKEKDKWNQSTHKYRTIEDSININVIP